MSQDGTLCGSCLPPPPETLLTQAPHLQKPSEDLWVLAPSSWGR